MRVGMELQLGTPQPGPWDPEGYPASDPYPPLLQITGLSGHIPRKWGAQALASLRQSDSTLAFLGRAPPHSSHNP